MLEQVRLKKKLSMSELARLCDMKRQHVHRVLSGKTQSPGLKTLRALCEAMDLDFALVLK